MPSWEKLFAVAGTPSELHVSIEKEIRVRNSVALWTQHFVLNIEKEGSAAKPMWFLTKNILFWGLEQSSPDPLLKLATALRETFPYSPPGWHLLGTQKVSSEGLPLEDTHPPHFLTEPRSHHTRAFPCHYACSLWDFSSTKLWAT